MNIIWAKDEHRWSGRKEGIHYTAGRLNRTVEVHSSRAQYPLPCYIIVGDRAIETEEDFMYVVENGRVLKPSYLELKKTPTFENHPLQITREDYMPFETDVVLNVWNLRGYTVLMDCHASGRKEGQGMTVQVFRTLRADMTAVEMHEASKSIYTHKGGSIEELVRGMDNFLRNYEAKA